MRCHTLTFRRSLIGALVLAGAVWNSAAAGWNEPPIVTDSASRPEPLAVVRTDAALVAPHLAPLRLDLPPTVAPERQIFPVGDFNRDGVVDAADFQMMMTLQGPCPAGEPCRGDFNGDGVVDLADVQFMLELLANPEAAARLSRFERAEVGYVNQAPAPIIDQAEWHPHIPEGRGAARSWVARLELQSEGAEGLRVQIAGLLNSGVMVRVYDPAGEAVLGPYSDPRQADEDGWWSPTIFGRAIGLELAREGGPPEEMPVITRIAYIYCGVECLTGPGTPLACHNDVTCYTSWANGEGRGVGLMGFISGGTCFACTGAVLNRLPFDFSPLFMTANHCISTQAAASTLEVRWQYQTSTCNGTSPNFNLVPRTEGALVVKRQSTSDYTLLALYEPPPPNYYAAWSLDWWGFGNTSTGVHHPAASWKRISFGWYIGTINKPFCDANGLNCFWADVFDVNYTNGTTQGGSSGSPVFDSDRRIRGPLVGGPAGCPEIIKSYGRKDLAYTNIRYFLNDMATPVVFVNNGFAGDPGNNGNLERGTVTNPFNTVHEATFAVRSSEEVRVTPGTYNEQMTIWRPVTITRSGTSGIVRIGAP
jgi:hypothetical protein